MRGKASGFSLIELLVAISLIALVGGTVTALVTAGGRVWARVRAHGTHAAWTETIFEQVRRDVHRARRFSEIPFKGTYEEVSFPVLISSETEDGTPYEQLGRLGYYFDSYHRQLCRSEQSYLLIRRTRMRESCEPVLTGVERVRFRYYALNADLHAYEWSTGWDAQEPPLAVKMEIRYDDQSDEERPAQALVVRLPIAPLPGDKDDDGGTS